MAIMAEVVGELPYNIIDTHSIRRNDFGDYVSLTLNPESYPRP